MKKIFIAFLIIGTAIAWFSNFSYASAQSTPNPCPPLAPDLAKVCGAQAEKICPAKMEQVARTACITAFQAAVSKCSSDNYSPECIKAISIGGNLGSGETLGYCPKTLPTDIKTACENDFKEAVSKCGTDNQCIYDEGQKIKKRYAVGDSEQNGLGQIQTDCNSSSISKDNCQIVNYLVIGINFLSALAGLAIVGSLVIAGFQYMTSRDNSSIVEASKKRMLWTIIALGVLLVMYPILNFLVPGGIF